LKDKTRQGPLERYLQILEIVTAASKDLTMTDVAEMTGLPKPTVHRLMRTLAEARLLRGNGKTFRPGDRLWRLVYSAADQETIVKYAQVICDETARLLNETSYIVRFEHTVARTLARAIPDEDRRHSVPGGQMFMHAAAAAKAILAFQPEDVLNRVLQEPLEKFTSRTKTSRAAFMEELALVRQNGYAIADREVFENIVSYAVPVHLPEAGVLFSVGVSGPAPRMQTQPAEYYVAPLRKSAEQFSRLLRSLSR
jgi:DNA-binding IclR family transcriptional regulator